MTTAATTTQPTMPAAPPPPGATAGAGGGAAGSTPAAPPAAKTETSPTTTTALGSAANGAAQPESTDSAQAKTDGTPSEVAPADVELKFPDGFKTDAEFLDGFKAWAKESGLKGEQAQKAADLHVKVLQKQAEAQRAGWEKQHKEWKDAQKADKEYGGAEYAKNVEVAYAAIAKFGKGDTELTELLKGPLGDHPALVRLMYRVGKAFAEDSSAGTSSGGPSAKNDPTAELRRIYPSMFTDSKE